MSHTYKDDNYCNTNSEIVKEFDQFSKFSDRVEHHILYQKVKSTIQKFGCLHQIDRVLIGLSGGVDSAMLLHFLFSIKEQSEIKVGRSK